MKAKKHNRIQTIARLIKQNAMLRIEVEILKRSIESAESALMYKETREDNNAEFIAKVLKC